LPPPLRERLRDGLAAWRRLGLLTGACRLAQLLAGRLALYWRRWWLARHPLRVRPDELRAALGGLSAAEALRGVALEALPTVRAFEDSLASLPPERRERLLRSADAVAAHIFDLLGSGPTDLGPRIDWRRDFKAGRAWPRVHRSRVRISHPDGSDIKVPWELSRFQHLPLLAAAFRLTGERRYLDEIGAQLLDWIDANPVEFGVNWACTMDVAIRAANWIAALAIIAGDGRGAAAPWLDDALASLLLHGRFIRSHLEWAPTRGNHYLSDVAGLLVVAALFSAGAEGRAWAGWATREILAELDHQVRPDGCDHEASIPYHRLVAELFICGLHAAEALTPGGVPSCAWERVAGMLRFTAAYTRPDGLAPQMGDADDGRFLPLADYGTLEHRCHDHLFAQERCRPRSIPRPGASALPTPSLREQAPRRHRSAPGAPPRPTDGHCAFPHGGWFVMRWELMHAIVRCGDVGLGGVGCHAHCDQLAFELVAGAQPLIVDPGSYVYTADLAARVAFRATAAHSTLELDGIEQNPIREDRPFQMEDRTHAELLHWRADGARARFEGIHRGYERLDPPATHERRIDFDGEELTLTITDTIRSEGAHSLRWSLPLAPCELELNGCAALARFPGAVNLSVHAPGLELERFDGWCSPSYGVRRRAPILRAHRRSVPGEDLATIALRVSSAAACQ
jgi:hypothetical protein